jgi:hypothetical protein
MWGLGLTLIGLPIARIASGGIFWPEAFVSGAHETIAIDFALLLGGAFCIRLARRWGVSHASTLSDAEPAMTSGKSQMDPAE